MHTHLPYIANHQQRQENFKIEKFNYNIKYLKGIEFIDTLEF